MKLVYRGAEAELYLDRLAKTEPLRAVSAIRKRRIEKAYKHPVLDFALRSSRTRKEARLLALARRHVNTPHVLDVDLAKNEISMEFVDGKRVKELFHAGKQTALGKKIGKGIRALHDGGIIHGDLTTSNMILHGGQIYFVDFGLGFVSNLLEDKATDLLVFKKMLKSTHFRYFDRIWKNVLAGYRVDKAMLGKIEEIEGRAKYMPRAA
jgi:Kae1-associated kinase Bud32